MTHIRYLASALAGLSILLTSSALAADDASVSERSIRTANDAAFAADASSTGNSWHSSSPSGTGASSALAGPSASIASSASGAPATSAKKAKHAWSGVPKVIAGAVAGIVVGTPVCAVRKTIDENKFAVSDMTGTNKEKKNIVTAAVLWAPFAAVTGVLESPFWAINNSLVNYDKPFSKEQLSLHQQTSSQQPEDNNQPSPQNK